MADKNVTNKHVYIGVGKEGLTPTNVPRVMEVDPNLLVEKIKAAISKTVKVYFDDLYYETHSTIEHQAVFNALWILHHAISTHKKNEKNPLY